MIPSDQTKSGGEADAATQRDRRPAAPLRGCWRGRCRSIWCRGGEPRHYGIGMA